MKVPGQLGIFSANWETIWYRKPDPVLYREKALNNVGHMTKMAAMPIYGKKPSNIFFSETNRLISMKLGVKHPWLKYYNVYINHDPVMTLTKFMARSTWVAHAFEWEKQLKCHLKGKASKSQEIGKWTEY